jgi:energy-coupling factor transporter transmembrane protein EcfT
MLVARRYRKRSSSFIQKFDPRAWLIFHACYLVGVITFWDIRYLLPFFALALFVLFTSGVRWDEIRKAFLFILGFVFFFAILTFLTGRGGVEHYSEERLIRDFQLTMDAQRPRGYELEKIEGVLIAQVRKLGPIFVPVTIHAIIGSENIFDAMDLRAFGVGPRSWLDVLEREFKDRLLIWFGVAIMIVSLVVGGILGARSTDTVGRWLVKEFMAR